MSDEFTPYPKNPLIQQKRDILKFVRNSLKHMQIHKKIITQNHLMKIGLFWKMK